MRTRLPPFSSVRAFEAAARHLSFKAAAEELHVSQSAISHQIHNLELFLHAPLFIRLPHGVELNALGESYLRQLTPLLDRLCACTEEALEAGLTRPLRVQTTPAFAARWPVPRIGDFNEQYPEIDLHITTSLEPPNFSRGDVDVVVQYGVEQADGLTVQPLDIQVTAVPVRDGDAASVSALMAVYEPRLLSTEEFQTSTERLLASEKCRSAGEGVRQQVR
jgi:LysR family transcriptional regulator, glycine cleavage system transcriptional activator